VFSSLFSGRKPAYPVLGGWETFPRFFFLWSRDTSPPNDLRRDEGRCFSLGPATGFFLPPPPPVTSATRPCPNPPPSPRWLRGGLCPWALFHITISYLCLKAPLCRISCPLNDLSPALRWLVSFPQGFFSRFFQWFFFWGSHDCASFAHVSFASGRRFFFLRGLLFLRVPLTSWGFFFLNTSPPVVSPCYAYTFGSHIDTFPRGLVPGFFRVLCGEPAQLAFFFFPQDFSPGLGS